MPASTSPRPPPKRLHALRRVARAHGLRLMFARGSCILPQSTNKNSLLRQQHLSVLPPDFIVLPSLADRTRSTNSLPSRPLAPRLPSVETACDRADARFARQHSAEVRRAAMRSTSDCAFAAAKNGPFSTNSCCSGVVVGSRFGTWATGSGKSNSRSKSSGSRGVAPAVERSPTIVRDLEPTRSAGRRCFGSSVPDAASSGIAPRLRRRAAAIHSPEPSILRIDRQAWPASTTARLPIRGRRHDLAMQPLERPAVARRTAREIVEQFADASARAPCRPKSLTVSTKPRPK